MVPFSTSAILVPIPLVTLIDIFLPCLVLTMSVPGGISKCPVLTTTHNLPSENNCFPGFHH